MHRHTILKGILKKEDMRVWTRFNWLKTVSNGDYCENLETFYFIKCMKFNHLSKYQHMEMSTTVWKNRCGHQAAQNVK